jgi:hypothetical protein
VETKKFKAQTNLSLRTDIKKRATGAIENCYLTGIYNLSKLIEVALEEYLNRKGIPRVLRIKSKTS